MITMDPGFEVLADWISRRDKQYRAVVGGWGGALVASGLATLMSDRWTLLPLVPLVLAAAWLAVAWAADRWWWARCGWAGHPVVHAEAAWSLASDLPLPPGWRDSPVVGELHRTTWGWTWRPSRLVTTRVHPVSWDAHDVAVVTVTPLWNPLAPQSAQLRLYLRGGRTVDLRVRHPSRIMPG